MDERKNDETKKCRRTETERERLASVSLPGTRPCHLTPATERAWSPCPLGRKSAPTNRNTKEEFMQIPTARGNECPLMSAGAGRRRHLLYLKDSHLEDYNDSAPPLDVSNTEPAFKL